MKHFPSPPVLSGTLSGFVVGVFVTLLVTGVFAHGSDTAKVVATLAPPVAVPDPLLYQRVRKIVVKQLGPSAAGSKIPRLVSLELGPAHASTISPLTPEGFEGPRSVIIQFHLYDNPLGKSWRLRSAKADIFAVAKALYTSRLPIYDVRMQGSFPLSNGRTVSDQSALIATIAYRTANHIPWRRWNRRQEAELWNRLTYKWVDPRFA